MRNGRRDLEEPRRLNQAGMKLVLYIIWGVLLICLLARDCVHSIQ